MLRLCIAQRVSLMIALALLMAACGSAGPQAREFNMEIKDGKPTKGTAVIKVNQDDTVTLKVATDKAAEFHLHGYDIEKQAQPDQPAVFNFTANATGRFNITIHGYGESSESDSHGGDEGKVKASGSQEEEEKVVWSLEVSPR